MTPTLTLQKTNSHPPFKCMILYDYLLELGQYAECMKWCADTCSSAWYQDVEHREYSKDRFWFADEHEAMLFMLMWS